MIVGVNDNMQRLNSAALAKMPSNIEVPQYDRSAVTAGIVHIGAGNFHRAHQAVYCDNLLNMGGTGWGIIGVSLRSPTMKENLAPQNFLYTQATLGKSTNYRIIGAIQNLLVAPEAPMAVIGAIASNHTQVLTTTITEKGYCLINGEINRHHTDFAQDLLSLELPKTAYGYIASALIKRSAQKGTPLTILCCDNVQNGGEHLLAGVRMLLKTHSSETLTWLKNRVAFSSSMVDRVTPATDEALKTTVAEEIGFHDTAPVAAEPFTQWIIEDNFAGTRPPFDKVGALFVDNIAPFENVKLRFLNASHSMLAALGYLAGDRFIHEALLRPCLARFAKQALKNDVLPVTSVPKSISGEGYIDDVFERFHNDNLPYAALQVGTDSSQKIQQRWFPAIEDALKQEHEASYLAFSLAAWVTFIRQALLNEDLNDPLHDDFANCEMGNDVRQFLALAGAAKFSFSSNDSFMAKVHKFHQAIDQQGIESSVKNFLDLEN